jgi:UDP-N-acetylmuramoyl-tripeptide--D-alanyl-D-alanine ligase
MYFFLHAIRTAIYHIFLLQRENYKLASFVDAASATLSPELDDYSARITWTQKLRLVVVIAATIQYLAAYTVGWSFSYIIPGAWLVQPILTLLAFLVLLRIFYIPLWVSTVIVTPFDIGLKYIIIEQARQRVAKHEHLKVVAVAGSYGKTTTKEVVAAVLSGGARVLKSQENYNTPLGIARLINSSLNSDTDVLVIEMGEYVPGDIKRLCAIAKPDVAIVSGINEAHLERMGTLANTTKAIFEVVTYSHPNASVILNADDKEVTKSYQDFVGDRPVHFYSATGEDSDYQIEKFTYLPGGKGMSFTIKRDKEVVGDFTLHLVGQHIVGAVIAGLETARALGIKPTESSARLAGLPPIPRRLRILPGRGGVTVVDDTYNASPVSMLAGLDTISEVFPAKRTVLILGDMLELGTEAEAAHRQVGERVGKFNPALLMVVGDQSRQLALAAHQAGLAEDRIHYYPAAEDLIEADINFSELADVVYLKASNAIGLEQVVDHLREKRNRG